jgi:hypothetical protein
MLSKKMHITGSLVIMSLAMVLTGPALAAPAAPATTPINRQIAVPDGRVAVRAGAPVTPQASNAAEGQRYSAREGNAKALETFRGGDGGIYLGSGVVVALLLVVLLVVLI